MTARSTAGSMELASAGAQAQVRQHEPAGQGLRVLREAMQDGPGNMCYMCKQCKVKPGHWCLREPEQTQSSKCAPRGAGGGARFAQEGRGCLMGKDQGRSKHMVDARQGRQGRWLARWQGG